MRPFRFLAEVRAIADGKTVAATVEKIGWVREAVGARFDDLEVNSYPSAIEPIITDQARAEAAKVVDGFRQRKGHELTDDEVLESPSLFIGSVDGFVHKFRMLRERFGISSIMLGEIDALARVLLRLAGT